MSAGETLTLFMALLALHWVADFVCQTHWQASNKSKNSEALLRHVGSYTAIMGLGAAVLFGLHLAVATFIAVNAVLHLVTDYFTSRWSSKLYAKQDWHNFFVVIGFDQLLHQSVLAATMLLLIRP